MRPTFKVAGDMHVELLATGACHGESSYKYQRLLSLVLSLYLQDLREGYKNGVSAFSFLNKYVNRIYPHKMVSKMK